MFHIFRYYIHADFDEAQEFQTSDGCLAAIVDDEEKSIKVSKKYGSDLPAAAVDLIRAADRLPDNPTKVDMEMDEDDELVSKNPDLLVLSPGYEPDPENIDNLDCEASALWVVSVCCHNVSFFSHLLLNAASRILSPPNKENICNQCIPACLAEGLHLIQVVRLGRKMV